MLHLYLQQFPEIILRTFVKVRDTVAGSGGAASEFANLYILSSKFWS